MAPDLEQQAVRADRVPGIGQEYLQQTQLELGQAHWLGAADLQGVIFQVQAQTSGVHW